MESIFDEQWSELEDVNLDTKIHENNEVMVKTMKRTKQKRNKNDIVKKIKENEEDNNSFLPLFCKPQVYQGYNMHFLKKSIPCKFMLSAEMKKTKFGYQIKKISKCDITVLNQILRRLNKNMNIFGEDVYMNGNATEFFNDSYPGELREFDDNIEWNITIEIQGYKTKDSGHMSPIWKVMKAHQAF